MDPRRAKQQHFWWCEASEPSLPSSFFSSPLPGSGRLEIKRGPNDSSLHPLSEDDDEWEEELFFALMCIFAESVF